MNKVIKNFVKISFFDFAFFLMMCYLCTSNIQDLFVKGYSNGSLFMGILWFMFAISKFAEIYIDLTENKNN